MDTNTRWSAVSSSSPTPRELSPSPRVQGASGLFNEAGGREVRTTQQLYLYLCRQVLGTGGSHHFDYRLSEEDLGDCGPEGGEVDRGAQRGGGPQPGVPSGGGWSVLCDARDDPAPGRPPRGYQDIVRLQSILKHTDPAIMETDSWINQIPMK